MLVPITNAMLAPANENIAKPRYSGVGATTDWHGGDIGNDADVAEATQAVANSHSINVAADYEPQHQEQKGLAMVPPLAVLSDLGMDYGAYTGLTGRDGVIEPFMPYPTTV